MDPDQSDITVGNLTEVTKQTELTDYRNFPDVLSYAKKVAPKLGRQFNLDPEDLIQAFMVKLVKSGYSLDKVKSYKAWTYKCMKRVALNQLRRLKAERASTEPLESEDGRSKEGRACKTFNRSYCVTADALELLLTGEQCAELVQKLRAIVEEILEPLPPRQRFVVRCFLKGVEPEDVARQIQRSRATTYKLAKPAGSILQRIVEELKLEALLLLEPDLPGALSDLVAISLAEEHASEYAGV